jgi:hypothetical protein
MITAKRSTQTTSDKGKVALINIINAISIIFE